MLELFISVLLLGIASMASPGILAISIYLLARNPEKKANIIAFILGGLVIAILLALAGFVVSSGNYGVIQFQNPQMADFLIGSLMMVFGFYSLFSKEGNVNVKGESKSAMLKLFLLGVMVNGTNIDAVFLNFTAAKEIAAADISNIYKLVLIAFADMLFIMPALLPLVAFTFMPEKSKPFLDRLNRAVKKYGKLLVCLIFFGFGIYFIIRSGILA
ncbi:MAG: GAP family protein [Candidatus Micrarchaeota archaeon]